MVQVIFKRMSRSKFAEELIIERLQKVREKFPNLKWSRQVITVSMENSPFQAGPDLFTIQFHCRTGQFRGALLKKSSESLYAAVADLFESLIERLSRLGSKERAKMRGRTRRMQRWLMPPRISEK